METNLPIVFPAKGKCGSDEGFKTHVGVVVADKGRRITVSVTTQMPGPCLCSENSVPGLFRLESISLLVGLIMSEINMVL